MSVDVKTFVREHFAKKLEKLNAKANDALEALKSNSIFGYKVVILSLWAIDGEESVVCRSKDLSKAIKKAEAKFLKINNRSEIQGEYIVYAIIESRKKKILVSLPDDYWKSLVTDWNKVREEITAKWQKDTQ